MKKVCSSFLFAFTAVVSVFASDPVCTNVLVRQRWPWSSKIDIDYELDASTKCDLAVTATWTGISSNVVLRFPALEGQAIDCVPGSGHLVWDPVAAGYSNAMSGFTVTVTPSTAKAYLVVDLLTGAHSWLADIPAGGWTNVAYGNVYRTTNMVFRHIQAGTFIMGSPTNEWGRTSGYSLRETQHQVTLTRDFYAGIFPVTREQYRLVTGLSPSITNTNDTEVESCPVNNTVYSNIRGGNLGTKWPASASIDSGCFLDILQKRTGLSRFDLPTDAQWEYACRAGTTSALYNGTELTRLANDPNMDLLGWYASNAGSHAHPVGQKLPNAWGLYDLYGSMWEKCLDWAWMDLSTNAVTDPVGYPVAVNISGQTRRIARGGTWNHDASYARSAYREVIYPETYFNRGGFRLFYLPDGYKEGL